MGYTYRGDQPYIPPGNKSGPPPKIFDRILCGSPKGYKQHVAFRQEKCQPCKDAYAAYQRGLRAKRAVA